MKKIAFAATVLISISGCQSTFNDYGATSKATQSSSQKTPSRQIPITVKSQGGTAIVHYIRYPDDEKYPDFSLIGETPLESTFTYYEDQKRGEIFISSGDSYISEYRNSIPETGAYSENVVLEKKEPLIRNDFLSLDASTKKLVEDYIYQADYMINSPRMLAGREFSKLRRIYNKITSDAPDSLEGTKILREIESLQSDLKLYDMGVDSSITSAIDRSELLMRAIS